VNSTTKMTPEAGAPVDLDAIVADLATLRSDFAALVSQMQSAALNGTNDAADSTLGQLGERASRLYDRVAEQGERSVKAVGRHVEERPVISLLIAFGVGFIASRLLNR
jgi:ElaB/YqjD/DUF883 family membrane-anchored ribosome-binding protein